MRDLRIFISSPGDVPDERLRAELVLDKLSQDYGRFFRLSTYRWEHEPMLASGHFQDAIEEPGRYDIFLLIVWSRLGTPLPERTAVRPYCGLDGRTPVTGTEWEFENALAAARENGTPEILAFRNMSPAPIDTYDPEARARSLAQLDALDAFWRRHFADKGAFIGAFEGYHSLGGFAHLLEQKLRKLIERRVAATSAAPRMAGAIWTGPPFRGLQAYEFEHAAIYFGRDAMIARAARHIAMAARCGEAFLLVAGASGSGKSSLVKAALVPRLMKPQRIEGLAFLRRIVFRPSDAQGDLVTGLTEAFVQDRRGDGIGLPELLGPGQTATDLAKHLRAVPGSPGFVFSAGLARITEEARKTGRILAHEQARAILVVDQLEELFTLDTISDDERTVFAQLLSGLAKSGLVWIVATMRSDFWHRIADVPLLLALAAGERRLDLAAPSPLELADMIRKPAEAAGLSFEEDRETGIGLDAELARRAAAEPGVLPLLSFALDALFQEDVVTKHGHVLTYATYETLGGLDGAIANRAEAIIGALPVSAQQAVPRVLRALTTVSDGVDAIAVARAAPLDMFPPGTDARNVVDALTAGRLLVASGDGGRASVRVAHEALIGRWKRAEEQVALDRRDLETRKVVERQYERWRANNDADLLLRDPDLANARALEARWGDDLETEHRAFVRLSLMAARSVARRRWMMAGVVMVLLAALTALSLGGLAIAAMQRDAALVAQSRALARDAHAALEKGDPTLAMLLALAALPRSLDKPDRPYVLDAEYPLADAFANRRERAVLRQIGNIVSIAYAPDGKHLAAVSNKEGFVWDATTGHPIVRLETVIGHLTSIEFSHDSRHLAGGTDDGTAYLWDATTGKIAAPPLTGHGAPVAEASFSKDDSLIVTTSDRAGIFDARSGRRLHTIAYENSRIVAAVFSPDGQRIATATDDGATQLWTREAVSIHSYPSEATELTAIAFSPDGSRLAAARDDGIAFVWDTGGSFAQVAKLVGHAARINTIGFSPDGQKILTASDDYSARIWNAATGAKDQVLLGHAGVVYSAAFSPDGARVITASGDRTSRVWDARTGFTSAVLGGNGAAVVSALFAPDGSSLATAANEPVARLWNPDTSAIVAVLRSGKGVVAGAFSPDGSLIATGSEDGVLRIWNGHSGARIGAWVGQPGTIRSVAFAPDGRTVVTASADAIARLWNVASGDVRTLEGHHGPINAARFSPDGQRIVTASADGTARIWDAATGTCLHKLQANDRVTDATFDAGGTRVLTTSSDGTSTVWNATSGGRIVDLRAPSFATAGVFSANGTRIATATGRNAGLWDARTYAPVAALSSGGSQVTSVAFAPDGKSLASAAFNGTVHLWHSKDGASLRPLVGHKLPVRSVAFASDETRLLTTSDDRTSRYWDVATGKTIAKLAGDETSVGFGAFAPSGDRILTASIGGTARLWVPPPFCQALIDAAHGVLPRGLTDDERKQYFLETRTRGWIDRLYDLSAPLFARVLPRAGDRCQ